MNNTIFYFFYSFAYQSVFWDKVIVFLAVYFPYLVILLAALFLIFYRKSWREFFIVFISSGLAWVIAEILKILMHAPRPFLILPGTYALFPELSFAFPSGHATFFMALAFSIFFLHKKTGLPAQVSYIFIFFALLIGLSRIIAGVHFPIDILGGFILGALVSFFCGFFSHSFYPSDKVS